MDMACLKSAIALYFAQSRKICSVLVSFMHILSKLFTVLPIAHLNFASDARSLKTRGQV